MEHDSNKMNTFPSFSWFNLYLSWIPTPSLLLRLQDHLFTLLLAALVLFVVFSWHTLRQKNIYRRPPGPRPWPIIGNLLDIGPSFYKDFQKLAEQYGPIFRMLLGSKETIIVSSPKIAEEILKTHDRKFASRPKLSPFTILNRRTFVMLPCGPFWRRIRKIFTLDLFGNRKIEQFQIIRKEEVLSALYSFIEACKGGKSVCLSLYLQQLSVNNMTRMVMSKSFLGPMSTEDPVKATEAIENLLKVAKLIGTFVIGDYIPILKPFDLQRCLTRMRVVALKNDKFLQEIIDERRQKLSSSTHHTDVGPTDFLDALVSPPTPEKELWTDDEIKGILLDVMLAGTDTTSTSLEWAMAELLTHPHVLKNAQDELDAVVGRDRLVEETDTPNLKYLRCIVMETLRLHPPGPLAIPHVCEESLEVSGYHIAKNTQVYINLYAIGRDPEIWEHALEFYPERFLSTTIDVHGQHFNLLPFGSGRRICPGKNLALSVLSYALATFLHACNWALPPGVDPEDVDFEDTPGSLVHCMRTHIEAVASPRLPMSVCHVPP